MGDRLFGMVCHSPVAGPGEEARCRFVLTRSLEVTVFVFPGETLRSFSRVRVEVNGKRPDFCVREFLAAPVVQVSDDVGVTHVPFTLSPADVVDIISTNSSGKDASLWCAIKGFVKEVP
jgi:hypothetical protein